MAKTSLGGLTFLTTLTDQWAHITPCFKKWEFRLTKVMTSITQQTNGGPKISLIHSTQFYGTPLRCTGVENGNPLQYPCLETPMDRGAWRATVHGVSKSQTQMKQLSMHYVVHTIWKKESEVAETSLILCNSTDCNLPGSSLYGIFLARILECSAISFSRGSTQPRDWTQVSHTAGRGFILWATREAPHTMQAW